MLPAALVLVACLPSGVAHGAPDPPEWMTRLLADYNDDFGGPDGHSAVRDGHELIALDVQEAYNSTLRQDTLVFRFVMNYGYDSDTTRPELKDVLTFKAKGQTATKELRTSNNQAFTGSFDAVGAPSAVLKSDGTTDGTRFYISGTLRYETLGLKVGDKLSEFFVQGYAGSAMADHMVGGYTVGNQRIEQEPPSEQADPQAYRKTDYTLLGPVKYARSEIDRPSVSAKPGENVTITWRITNNVGRSQTFTLTNSAPSNVAVGMHSGQFSKDRLVISLQAGVTATVHVYVTPEPGARAGAVTLDLETSLGGHLTHAIDVSVASATASSTASSSGAGAPAKGAPGAGAILVLATALMAALLVPRRSR